jgi:hypothetical protein
MTIVDLPKASMLCKNCIYPAAIFEFKRLKMGIIDNIHTGKLHFNENNFTLMKIDFLGNLLLNENILSDNNTVTVYYGITGEIKIIIDIKREINTITADNQFIQYKIIGEDTEYLYAIDNCFFLSSSFVMEDGKIFHRYGGKLAGEIIITNKNNYEPNLIVCDCIGSEIPYFNDGITIKGIEILIQQNKNYFNNKEFIDHVFKNILGTTFQYEPILPINYEVENKLYHNIELLLTFLSGQNFGISIIKYINKNSIIKYIIKDKFTLYNNSHFILSNDIEKINKLIDKTNFMDFFGKDYFKETINSLARINNETDLNIKWAVLIMAMERFLLHILIENGKNKNELESSNVIQKIAMYNKILHSTTGKSIPGNYNDDILRVNYRNALFHSGDINGTTIHSIYYFFIKYMDFFYQLILNYVGYDDQIILMGNNYKFGKLF